MEKTVPAFEARRKFGRLLQEVTAHGERYIVERHGEAVAAVVPIDIYEQWKLSREAFFTQIRSLAERSNQTEDEAEQLAREATDYARRQK